MRMYATVTSERASKGQGGQQFIETVFTGENENHERIELTRVNMRHDPDTGHITLVARGMGGQQFTVEIQGKR